MSTYCGKNLDLFSLITDPQLLRIAAQSRGHAGCWGCDVFHGNLVHVWKGLSIHLFPELHRVFCSFNEFLIEISICFHYCSRFVVCHCLLLACACLFVLFQKSKELSLFTVFFSAELGQWSCWGLLVALSFPLHFS